MNRILVVEDEAALRTLVVKTLEKQGYEVSMASNGAEALEIFEPGEYALVVTDVMMPEMGGLELIEHLSKKDPQVRIITISGMVHHNLRDDGEDVLLESMGEAGNVVCHIKKPFSIEELLSVVEKAV